MGTIIVNFEKPNVRAPVVLLLIIFERDLEKVQTIKIHIDVLSSIEMNGILIE